MKVNILLSTYNGEQYLKEQVKSIQDQTYQDWQLLIRDDGSTDGTVEIIQELVAQDERIRFINQGAIENLGRLLQIPTPVRIESFDNSNIMGTSPVSAMVVFVNGKPSKKDYPDFSYICIFNFLYFLYNKVDNFTICLVKNAVAKLLIVFQNRKLLFNFVA